MILGLRLAIFFGLAITAALGPLLLIPFVNSIHLGLVLLLIPLSPLATVLLLGVPWVLALRPFLMQRVSRHLVLAEGGPVGSSAPV